MDQVEQVRRAMANNAPRVVTPDDAAYDYVLEANAETSDREAREALAMAKSLKKPFLASIARVAPIVLMAQQTIPAVFGKTILFQ